MIQTAHETWIIDAVNRSMREDEPIPDEVARAIAAFYHSPSIHDEQITRLSHNVAVTDIEALRDQIARARGIETDHDYRRMLDALDVWAWYRGDA